MKAIIVPGVTDMNKGDQALVWETHRLVQDTGLFPEIFILNSGDTETEIINLTQQSADRGFKLIENILPHPRRGKHKDDEHIRESSLELAAQTKNAAFDLISTKLLLSICNDLKKVKKMFPEKVYRTVKHFSEAETVFVKGGGFIHAYGEKTAPYLMWYFLFYIRLAQKLGKKVVFMPNSFGPFKGFTVENQVKSVIGKMDLVFAREHVSAKSLGQLLNKKISVEMDLGFFLQKGNSDRAEELLTKYGFSAGDKIIGITVRPWRFPGLDNPEILYDKYISSIVHLIEYMVGNGYKVALCNQSLGPNSHEDDRNAIKEVLQRYKHSNVIWINENLNCEDLKTLYSRFYFFVGTRFHSIIFALTSLVPSIAIGYGGNKAKGIMGDFSLDEFVVDIDKVQPELLVKMFDNAISQYEVTQQKLSEALHLIEDSRNRLISDINKMF